MFTIKILTFITLVFINDIYPLNVLIKSVVIINVQYNTIRFV